MAILSGRVTRWDGGVIADAVIAISAHAPDCCTGEPVVVTADTAGGWSATVTRGSYVITATARGHIPASRLVRVGNQTPTDDLDLRLAPGGSTISGMVTERHGQSLLGACVTAVTRDPKALTYRTITGSDGHYELTLADGRYDLRATHAESTSDMQPLEVAGQPLHANLEVYRRGGFRGRVVARDSNQPIAGALIELDHGYPVTRTNADGEFAVWRDGNTYLVTARARGYQVRSGVRVVVHRDELVEGIELVAERAFAITGRAVERGRPHIAVEGVMMFASDGARSMCASAPTDEHGNFEIVGVVSGDYLVGASFPWLCSFARVSVVDGDTVDVAVAVSAGATISGRVEPPMVAVIEYEPADELHAVHALMSRISSDQSGAFTLFDVPAGRLTIRVASADGHRGALAIEVGEADLHDLVIPVARLASISGRVVDTNGRSIADVLIEARLVHQPGHRYTEQANSGFDGTFKIVGLVPGAYSVTAEDASAVDVIVDGMIDRPGITIIAPARDGVIRGRVIDCAGRPAPYATVTLGRERAAPRLLLRYPIDSEITTTADAAGCFTFAHLLAASYAVWAEHPRGGAHGGQSCVAVGHTITVVVRPLGALRLDVFHNGERVHRFGAHLRCVTSVFRAARDDVGAPFTFAQLASGDYEWTVTNDAGIASGHARVEPAGETTKVVELASFAVATGKVISATSGRPVSDIRVFVEFAGDCAVTNCNGEFRFERLPPGEGIIVFCERESITAYVATRRYSAMHGQVVDLGTIAIPDRRAAQPGTLGMVVERRAAALTVISVQPSGPAARQGIMIGDVIDSFDGQLVADLTVELAAQLLAPGIVRDRQVVTLGIQRMSTPIHITATRWE